MELRALHPALGLEVCDLDVAGTVPASVVDELRAGLDRAKLLVFRCPAALPPERQVAITAWFGAPLEPGGDGPPATVLDNVDNAGRVELRFHSDLTFMSTPVELITLHALELPAGGTRTCFVNGAAAWSTLPDSVQHELQHLTLRHREHSTDFPEFDGLSNVHPVRLDHPRTGEPVLFVTENHAERIEELSPEESDALIARLQAHLYAPANIYEHRWQPFDLLVWDNLAIQHARPDDADPARGARRMQRVAVGGPPMSELLAVLANGPAR